MTGKRAFRPVRAVLRIGVIVVCTALVVVALGLVLFLQDTPLVADMAPPTAEDVAETRELVRDIRAAAGEGAQSNTLLTTGADRLNSAIRLGARFIDGFRGRVTIGQVDVLGEMSLPVPWWGGQKWLNLSGRVPEFDQRVSLSQVTVGSVDIPPAMALGLARHGANLAMGNRFGDKVLNAASLMEINGSDLSFRITLDDMGRNGVMQSAFGTLRGAEMPGVAEVEAYYLRIRQAMEDGELTGEDSFLPYLRFTLQAAFDNATPQTLPNTYTAAVFGLARACGAWNLSMIAGRIARNTEDTPDEWSAECDEITFNGRIDSRRHFITSAALQAASNTGFSVSVGEFKELYDTISGAGGFDFTDMAANLSGIRMSNLLMATPYAEWPALLALIETDNDVIVPFDGIPQLMPREEFTARFGDVNSPQYREMIAAIEARIDKIALHAP